MMGLADLYRGLTAFVPKPILAGLAVLLVLWYIPNFYRGLKTKQFSEQVRTIAKTVDPVTKSDLTNRILDAAGRNPTWLVAIGDAAIQYQQRPLGLQVLDRLRTTQVHPRDAQRLQTALLPDRPKAPSDAISAYVQVKRLIDEGLLVQAAHELERARARFPDDEELAHLTIPAANPPSAEHDGQANPNPPAGPAPSA